MGRKGLFSSAAAGISLVAASLVLVIGVSAMIGFRGFKSARETPTSQRVVLRTPAAEREAAATAPVVIGGKQQTFRARPAKPTARRSNRTARPSRTQSKKAPASSGLSAPSQSKPAPATEAEAPAAPAAPDLPTEKAPVDEVVEDVVKTVDEVAKPVESGVGDVLLDLRDALP